MRILVSNPDTIGDVVLRQPLLRALQEAGHTLMLLVRPLVEPIAPMVAPGASVRTIGIDAYHPYLEAGDDLLAGVVEEARRFAPDIVVAAPFQWTAVEERLAAELTDARVVAFAGRRYVDPRVGPRAGPGLRTDVRVEAEEETPELEKNARLAAAVLGREVSLPLPSIEATPEALAAADAELEARGLGPGTFWAACVGESASTAVRNWPLDRWSRTLAAWSKEHGRRFLLIGQAGEREASERVRAGMGEGAAAGWHGSEHASLPTLVGLLARSAGYVGRDTGPMHLAAALGKPVLAVFGGGTWPRFVPAASRGVVVTVPVPCAGCGWRCHLPSSYCIKEVPEAEVLRAAGELERGEVNGCIVRLLEPAGGAVALLERIGRESAEAVRRMAGRPRAGADAGVSAVGDANATVALTVERSIQSVAEAHDRAGRAEMKMHELGQQLAGLRAHAAKLEAAREEHDRARAQLAAQVADARKAAVEAEARAAAAEELLRERTAELIVAREKLAAKEAKTRGEAELRAELEAEHRRALAAAEAGLRTRESRLKERLAAAEVELAKRDAQAQDLRTRLDRVEAERESMGQAMRRQQTEIATLRTRLDELLASRWRKLGQRLHLAMTLPWEREAPRGAVNGSPRA